MWRCCILRYLLIMTTLFLVTGCSELRTIGSAAVRELKADGINVERARTASINTTPSFR